WRHPQSGGHSSRCARSWWDSDCRRRSRFSWYTGRESRGAGGLCRYPLAFRPRDRCRPSTAGTGVATDRALLRRVSDLTQCTARTDHIEENRRALNLSSQPSGSGWRFWFTIFTVSHLFANSLLAISKSKLPQQYHNWLRERHGV